LVQISDLPEELDMAEQRFTATAHTTAAPATVYALLRNGSTWPTWSPIGSFSLEHESTDGGEGLGAIRLFRTKSPTGTVKSRERIVELVPDRRFSYEAFAGMPIKGHRADVDLESTDDGGTTIRWAERFSAKVPGTGGIYRRALQRFVQRCVDGLATHAADVDSTRERRSA
jgi:uncharacterized protein YndB with AHSA1/START domain